jgi:hypothetical protein
MLKQRNEKYDEHLRSMTGEQRILRALGMFDEATQIVRESITEAHPDWNEEQILREMRRRFKYDR